MLYDTEYQIWQKRNEQRHFRGMIGLVAIFGVLLVLVAVFGSIN